MYQSILKQHPHPISHCLFFDFHVEMMQPRRGDISLYESYTRLHATSSPSAHLNHTFLPWHRAFLYQFETDLIQANSEIHALPYWDMTVNYATPHQANIWEDRYLGGSSSDGGSNASCVPNGPFQSWNPVYPQKDCLRRGFNMKTGRSSGFANADKQVRFTSPMELNQVLKETNFQRFHEMVQYTLHAIPHIYFGGKQGTMNALSLAANDPLFYLHHGNMDYIWYQYEQLHPSVVVPELDVPLVGLRYKIRDTIKSEAFCVAYQPYSGWILTTDQKTTTEDTKPPGSLTSSTTFPATTSATTMSNSHSTTTPMATSGISSSSRTLETSTHPSSMNSGTGTISTTITSILPTNVPTPSSTLGTSSTSTSIIDTNTTISESTHSSSLRPSVPVIPTSTSRGGAVYPTFVPPYPIVVDNTQQSRDYWYEAMHELFERLHVPFIPPKDTYFPAPSMEFMQQAHYPVEVVKECMQTMHVYANKIATTLESGSVEELVKLLPERVLQQVSDPQANGTVVNSGIKPAFESTSMWVFVVIATFSNFVMCW
jgi:hypothetical protein